MQKTLTQRKLDLFKLRLGVAFQRTKAIRVNIELNERCSGNCPFCVYKTKDTPRSTNAGRAMPFPIVDSIGERFESSPFHLPASTVLYLRTDPLDYEYKGKTVVDVHRRLSGIKYAGSIGERISNAGIVTAVPEGKEDVFFELFGARIPFDLTLSFMNSSRLQKHPEFQDFCHSYGLVRREVVGSFSVFTKKEWEGKVNDNHDVYLFEKEMEKRSGYHGALPRGGGSMLQVLGTEYGAFVYSTGEQINGQKYLRVNNQITFSRMVIEERIKPGEPFICSFWEHSGMGAHLIEPTVTLRVRDWDIQPRGKIYSEGLKEPRHFLDSVGIERTNILVTWDGAIYLVNDVPRTIENPTGLGLELFSGPIVE